MMHTLQPTLVAGCSRWIDKYMRVATELSISRAFIVEYIVQLLCREK
jgi:hypothetical protein